MEFLRHWFAGLVAGLGEVDEAAREAILRACGQACADSYTAEMFRHARAPGASTNEFLAALGRVFPEATYELTAPGEIRVCYDFCACDLVKLGLVTSPLLCGCSVHNLRENFEHALGVPVEVTLEASILQGAPHCAFLVRLR
ncbi:MAG TPA: hypothetical protein VLC95_07320 [Anaerolineae bacterium]|nr:hypothetical protein [Anaerolineae bacterium]